MTPGTALALPAELVDLLRGSATCYVSTVMPDGSPQVTQTWADTDGRHVLINTVRGYQKARNVERDPRVALGLSSATNPSRYYEVRGHVTDATTAGAKEHIEVLAQRYLGGPYPWYGGPDQERLLLRISPVTINSMG